MKFHFSNILCLLLFSFHSLFSQVEWNSKRDKIVIPFELSNNLIIIDVLVNNVNLSMLLDTGSDRNLLFSFPQNDTIEFYNTKKIKINGFGKGDFIEGFISRNNILQINGYVDNNFELLLIADNNINIVNKLGIPINGIIGFSFFKDYIVELNYHNNKVVMYKKFQSISQRKIKRFNIEKLNIIDRKPYFILKTNIGNSIDEVKLLMDSGLGDGLWLFENDTIKSIGNYIKDILGTGLGGDVLGKRSRVKKVLLSKFKLDNVLVSFPNKTSYEQLNIIKGRNGSLGGEIIKRFNWLIDYKNGLIYFKPNKFFKNTFNYNMSGIGVQHKGVQWVIKDVMTKNPSPIIKDNDFVFDNGNTRLNYKYKLKPVFEIYSIRENSPGKRAGLKVGDVILSINGRKGYLYTLQKITDLFRSEEGKSIIVEVDRSGEILKFKFELEKIL